MGGETGLKLEENMTRWLLIFETEKDILEQNWKCSWKARHENMSLSAIIIQMVRQASRVLGLELSIFQRTRMERTRQNIKEKKLKTSMRREWMNTFKYNCNRLFLFKSFSTEKSAGHVHKSSWVSCCCLASCHSSCLTGQECMNNIVHIVLSFGFLTHCFRLPSLSLVLGKRTSFSIHCLKEQPSNPLDSYKSCSNIDSWSLCAFL